MSTNNSVHPISTLTMLTTKLSPIAMRRRNLTSFDYTDDFLSEDSQTTILNNRSRQIHEANCPLPPVV